MTKQAPTQTTPAKGSIGKKPVLPFILFPQTQMTRAVANSKRPPVHVYECSWFTATS